MTSHEAEMDCHELAELVTDYLEDALPEGDRRRLDVHLAECDGCTVYLEQVRTTIRLTGMLTEDQIPPEGRAELLHVFRAWRAGSRT